jgi:hypothetical protein
MMTLPVGLANKREGLSGMKLRITNYLNPIISFSLTSKYYSQHRHIFSPENVVQIVSSDQSN